MTPRDVVNERLRRIAEHVHFRHYVVCSYCFSPIVLTPGELDAPPNRLICDACGKDLPFESAGVQEYAPRV